MTPRQASRAADIFTGLVVASVAVALAALTWRLSGARTVDRSSPAAGRIAALPADITPILAMAPFGRADRSSAQPTALALVLRGIVLADPVSASQALIAPVGGRPTSYSVGQAVPGGATIEEISLSRVLLRVNGRLERLDLPRLGATDAAPSVQAGSAAQTGAMPSTGPSYGSGPQPMQPLAGPPAAPVGDLGSLALLGRLGAAPDGGVYRVGAEPSVEARRAGLMPGDIIERVNGLPATAVVNDRQLIAQALAAGPAQIDVLRGGKRISFSFALR